MRHSLALEWVKWLNKGYVSSIERRSAYLFFFFYMCDSYLKAAPFQLKAVEYYIFFRVQRLFEDGALTIIDLIYDIRLLCWRLWTNGIKAMSRDFSGDKQVIKFVNARNRGRVCLFQTIENKELFMLKTIINGKLWLKAIIVTFLDAVATVDVLRPSNNVANLSKLELYIHFARLLNRPLDIRE